MITHCLSAVILCLLLSGAQSQSVQNTTKVGGTGGAFFTDQTAYNANGALSGLKIWIDDEFKVINAIQAQYGTTTWATAHGGDAYFFGTPQIATLQLGESITAVTLASANAEGESWSCVCYLKFETSRGRTFGPYDAGCGAGSATRFVLDNGLAYLSGWSGNMLDALVLNYFPSSADPCTSSPCWNDGACTKTSNTAFTCACTAGFTGATCDIGVDPCDNQPCQHGGSCFRTSRTTYRCDCTSKYEGVMCEKLICISNPTTDCDLVGTNYGKYAYCSDCGMWVVCKAKKRKTRSCLSRSPNVYYNRVTKNCTATQSSCAGLTGLPGLIGIIDDM